MFFYFLVSFSTNAICLKKNGRLARLLRDARTFRDTETQGSSIGSTFAGRAFESAADLVEHIEAMKPKEDSMLNTSDALLLFHLVLHDQEFSRISQPIRCVRRDSDESTFSAELQDGSRIEIPWQRAVQLLAHKNASLEIENLPDIPDISDAWETGQILEIRGLREGTTFSMVRSALARFGNVPYVEVLRIPPGARCQANFGFEDRHLCRVGLDG